MQSFTVHWSQISPAAPPSGVAEGCEWFALWPSPANDDVCFREAGFTDFADSDEAWDNSADELLTRLLAELSLHGPPKLESKPVEQPRPWYRRPFTEPEPFDVRRQIELPREWDSLPGCVVAFGESGVSLRTGSGHHIYWIGLPRRAASSFAGLVARVAGSHPVARTDLRWEKLFHPTLRGAAGAG